MRDLKNGGYQLKAVKSQKQFRFAFIFKNSVPNPYRKSEWKNPFISA